MQQERRNKHVWKQLFLIRHGESTANEVNRFAGAIDVPLSRLGQAQARRAADSWDGQPFDQAYVSPMTRTRQTAGILLDRLGPDACRELCFDERIVERDFGDFTLQNKTRLQRRFGIHRYEAPLYRPDDEIHGGETFADFRERVLDFLKNTLYPALCEGKRVLVVAHKYVIELLARLVLRLPEHQGHDLRLPNGKILSGAHLNDYVRRESPRGNRLREWIVVQHSVLLSVAAMLGLGINYLWPEYRVPPGWLLALLLATAISLARTSLEPPERNAQDPLLDPRRIVLRFVLIPWLVVAIGPHWLPRDTDPDQVLAVALLLGAPTAVTALILSRSTGGVILPTVLNILLTTVLCAVNLTVMLLFKGLSDFTLQAFSLAGLSLICLILPLFVAQIMRWRYPIWTAHAAENHAAGAVLSLALFVALAFQNIPLASADTLGLLALATGIALRLLALLLTRWRSLYSLDDYFSGAYPNIFLVILLANILDNPTILELATWFAVPMFILAPLDDLLITRLHARQPDSRLREYLRISA
ncbi:histidine phosphatase family protein [endosymbiont of unidentified scaly snail isolate Monju]|uniref:histidine phosphatase family protein n=1 Tax=endosymbiont of unidentified scaly snail isolate Monju TaxID=1248727 RepID=UPI0009DCD9A1|nr:histidine phosphatase family protein [endosymbiont of unidentified scaly snail isolate Monju]